MALINKFKEFWLSSPRSIERDCLGKYFPLEIEEYGLEFRDLCNSVRGFSSPQTLAALNIIASRFLLPSENYLEIGTFCGRSLIATLINNNIKAHVIDDHEFRGHTYDIGAEFKNNIFEYKIQDRITFYNSDYRNFNQELPDTIGLYLFDGPHELYDSLDGLNNFKYCLRDQAIILVDDYARTGVQEDVLAWVKKHPESELLDIMGFSEQQAIILFDRNKGS